MTEPWKVIDEEACRDLTPKFKRIECLSHQVMLDYSGSAWELIQRRRVTVFEWAPGDMTRYTVVVSGMPCTLDGVPAGEGVLVSVLHPTQACALFMDARSGELFSSYVAQNLHLSEHDRKYTAEALTILIGTLLNRTPVVSSEWWEQVRWHFMTDEAIAREQDARRSRDEQLRDDNPLVEETDAL